MSRRSALAQLALSVALSALPACGEASTEEGRDPGGCEEAAELLCQRFAECSGFWFDAGWESQSVCRADFSERCHRERNAAGSGLTDASIAQCAQGRVAHCELVVAMVATPDPVGYEPTLPSECVPPPGQLPDGAQCEYDSQCQSRVCAYDQGCRRCVPGLPEGAACETSAGSSACAVGLTCHSTCTPIRYAGQPCSHNLECAGLLVCTDAICAFPSTSAPGTSCAEGCAPMEGVFCGLLSMPVCESVTLVASGGKCDDPLRWCHAGLRCDTTSGVCEPNPEACSSSADCAPGERCELERCYAPTPETCPPI